MNEPFFFYGAHPADWFEGANDGHFYEIRFVRTPDADARKAIADRFERATSKGAASPAGAPWLWSGPFALFAVGERWTGAARSAFGAVQGALRAIHEVAPIDQVVFRGTRVAGNDAWTSASVAARPEPTPGPKYPGHDAMHAFHHGDDASLPAPARDDEFENARQAVRADIARAQAASKATGAAPGEIVAVPADDASTPASPIPAAIAARFPGGSSVFQRDGRIFGFGKAPCEYAMYANNWRLLSFLEGDAVVSVSFPEEPMRLQSIAVRADGRAAYVVVDTLRQQHLCEITLPEGRAAFVWSTWAHQEGKQSGVQCTADGRIAVVTDKAFHLFEREGDGVKEIASAKAPGAFGLVRASDGLYVSGALANKTRVYVFGVGGDKVKVLARLTTDLDPYTLRADGGRVFGSVTTAKQDFELVHLGEAYDAAFAPKKSKKSAKPK